MLCNTQANCMDEYQVLAAFEERASLAFDTPIEDGFTFVSKSSKIYP